MPKFRLGKREARPDHRIPRMEDRINVAQLPPLPAASNWYASQPVGGIPLLGNDRYGCCVQASIAHFIAAISKYVTPNAPLVPTEAEVLKMYADMTGFKANDPSTDQGTYMVGPGSAVEHWWQHGVVVGGKLNRPAAVAHVDYTNQYLLHQAIELMGFVFIGADMRQVDVDSDFAWKPSSGPVVGGHEFLVSGRQTIGPHTYYDVETWNGMWRCNQAWFDQSVNEAAIVFDRAFFDTKGIDPAGVAWADLARDMGAIGHA